jgi:hypothetical protein
VDAFLSWTFLGFVDFSGDFKTIFASGSSIFLGGFTFLECLLDGDPSALLGKSVLSYSLKNALRGAFFDHGCAL